MSDLISRQSAIVQLSHNKTGDDDCDVVIQNDIETIKALPSAEPKLEQITPSEQGESDKLGVKSGKTCTDCIKHGGDWECDRTHCRKGTKQQATKASDCISRQATIDVLHEYFDGMLETDTWSPCDVYGLIEILPSAQPELCEDAVSRQRLLSDLKELIAAWKKYPVMAEQIKGVETAIGYVKVIPSVKPDSKELSSTHKALDTISRQAAIDTSLEFFVEYLGGAFDENSQKDLMARLQRLPSAEPERKKGSEKK